MNWEDCIKIGLTVVASLGGGGAIIAGFVHFCGERIADALSKQYELKMQKEFEKYRSNIENKTYISKTKFDTEFALYRELSSAFSKMVKAISILIPYGLTMVPANREERLRMDKEHYKTALEETVAAQDTINANIPFIPENIYDGYVELLQLARLQLGEYEDRFNLSDARPQNEKESFSFDAYQRTREMSQKWKSQNTLIRDYISQLDVLEDR